MKRNIILFFFLSTLVLFFGCTQEHKRTLKIGTNLWIGNEPLYLAARLNLLPEKKFKLIEFPSTTEVIRAFKTKSIDLASLTMDETISLIRDGFDIRALLVLDKSHGADALVARSSIRNISQLKGKKIGVEHTALGGYFLSLFLAKSGLTQNDLKIVYMEISKHEEAFKNKQVDAVITFEPILTKIKNAGGTVLFDSKSLPGKIIDILIVNSEVLKTHPDELKEIIQAWDQSTQYIIANLDKSAEFIGKRENIKPEEYKKALSGIRLIGAEENQNLLGHPKELKNILEELNQYMTKSQQLPVLDISRLFLIPSDWHMKRKGK